MKNIKFRKDLFYSVDQWLSEQLRDTPLDEIDGETQWLLSQAKNAREALEEHLEGMSGD